MVQMRARLQSLEQMTNFWQSKYNEAINASRQNQPQQQPGQRQSPPGQQEAPGEIAELEPPPENWETTNDVVSYFDKRTQTRTQQVMEQAYNESVKPQFDRFNGAIGEIFDRFVKPQLEDFDDIVKGVNNNHLFVMDPTGQNAIAVKNQALLDYFLAQRIPQLAMYDWGLSQKAPQKIKEGTEKAKKELIGKIKKKPKTPTQIKSGGAVEAGDDELDWNTPSDKVEQILHKKRLI